MPVNNENNSSTMGGVWNAGKYMVPLVGTAYSLRDAYYNPSLENITMAGASAITDAASLMGVGLLAKPLIGLGKARRALNVATKGYNRSVATAKAAQEAAAEAAYNAKRARNASNSVTLLQGGDRGVSRVTEYEKNAQAAEAAAKQAVANERAAMKAMDGSTYIDRVVPTKNLVEVGDNAASYIAPWDNFGGYYTRMTKNPGGALGRLEDAQREYGYVSRGFPYEIGPGAVVTGLGIGMGAMNTQFRKDNEERKARHNEHYSTQQK